MDLYKTCRALWGETEQAVCHGLHGPSGTIAVLSILKLLSKTVFADRKYNAEGCELVIPPNVPFYEHFLTQHTDLNIDSDSLLSQIYLRSEELFQTGLKLSKFV